MFDNGIKVILAVDELVQLTLWRIDGELDAIKSGIYDGTNLLWRGKGTIRSQIDISVADLLRKGNVLRKLRHDERFACRIKTTFACTEFIRLTKSTFNHLGLHLADFALHLLMGAEEARVVASVGEFKKEVRSGERRREGIEVGATSLFHANTILKRRFLAGCLHLTFCIEFTGFRFMAVCANQIGAAALLFAHRLLAHRVSAVCIAGHFSFSFVCCY